MYLLRFYLAGVMNWVDFYEAVCPLGDNKSVEKNGWCGIVEPKVHGTRLNLYGKLRVVSMLDPGVRRSLRIDKSAQL
jgi:hypothetical protein